ncbi:MAG TPA: FAD/NAD(P)-binding oxidoreductase, partial [Clostridium sp.]|nr:FAD/NAD(P)-binding oxidoreductase [Clostridium sp.]
LEPNISLEIAGALHAPTGGIVGPWEYTIALMENAVVNGVRLQLSAEVTSIEKLEDGYTITINDSEKPIYTKYIVNAAGIYADKVHNMVAKPAYTISPRKGQYFVMDKTQGELVKKTIFQCPNEHAKGVLVTPTVH